MVHRRALISQFKWTFIVYAKVLIVNAGADINNNLKFNGMRLQLQLLIKQEIRFCVVNKITYT